MPSNDNSVNIKPSNDYHHGDLRSAALMLGMERIEGQERPDLGLRALARDLGVSATALYRHFPNKDALLDALAMESLDRLGEDQDLVAKKLGGGLESFAEVGITYVKWAVKHPALFRLIYSRLGQVDLSAGGTSKISKAFRQLREGVAAVMPDDYSDEYRRIAALNAWSLVHGLAMLILDGQVEYDEKLIRQVVLGSAGGR